MASRMVWRLLLVFGLFYQGFSSRVVRCATENFGRHSERHLLSLLSSSKSALESEKPYTVIDSLAVFDNAKVVSTCDMILINIPASLVKLNEQALMEILQRAYKSVFVQEERKKDIVVVVSGTADEIMKADLSLRKLLAEAWILIEKPTFISDDIEEECNIHFVPITKANGGVSSESLTTGKSLIKSIVDKQLGSGGVDIAEFVEGAQVLRSGGDSRSSTNDKVSAKGYEITENAKVNSLLWAQSAAQASATRLQKQEKAGEFRSFMENLVKTAQNMYKDAVETAGKGAVSPFMFNQGLKDVASQIYTMLLPFFRRHVQLARVEAAKAFNAAAGDDLAITTDIMRDLRDIRDKTVRDFESSCAALVPAGAPGTSWGYTFDAKQLIFSLDEYLESREAQARLVGVLPRGRKPIDVSVHFFANHPLGKDYRQDSLTLGNRDSLDYDPKLANVKSVVSISPSKARSALKKKAESASLGWVEGAHVKEQSEFAREMLMFPLSVKNPEVPLATGRGKKQSSIDSARQGEDDFELGPQRFVDWGVDPAMREAKRALDKKSSITGKRGVEQSQGMKDAILNTVPFFRKGHYKHPSLRYDEN